MVFVTELESSDSKWEVVAFPSSDSVSLRDTDCFIVRIPFTLMSVLLSHEGFQLVNSDTRLGA